MNSVGMRLREERMHLGLSQTELGDVAGVTKNTQMLYENDKRSPKTDYLEAIGNAGIDILYVLTGERRGSGDALSLIDADFMAEIAAVLDRVLRQSGKSLAVGAESARTLSEVYNFMVQEQSRDMATAERALRLVVNRQLA